MAPWVRRVLPVFFVVLAGTALIYVVVQGRAALQAFDWHLSPAFLIVAVTCHAVSLGATYVVWRSLMTVLGSDLPGLVHFRVFFLSLAARKLPTPVWYLGTRSYLYRAYDISAQMVLRATGLEYGIAFLGGVWAMVLLLPLVRLPASANWVRSFALPTAILLTIVLIAKPKALLELSLRLMPGKKTVRTVDTPSRWHILLWLSIYFAAWIVGGMGYYFTIRALVPSGGPSALNAVGIATVSTLLVLLNSVIPYGIGIQELSSTALLTTWFPASISLVIAVVYRIVQTMDDLLWITISYFLKTPALEDLPST